MVGLKYCSATMRCDRVVDGEGGAGAPPAELICSLGELSLEQPSSSSSPLAEASAESSAAAGKRPKGNISWVSAEEAVRAEVRVYSHLFTVDSPDDKWEEQVLWKRLIALCTCLCTPRVCIYSAYIRARVVRGQIGEDEKTSRCLAAYQRSERACCV